ncbi:hypothetical protein Acy02nite_89260 [Actinoplanes cyaneus]|uniref:histidine kinase n=1 Tax=Actinoplanes cyaneus TaxID=52696 RepID=A0A919M613_9ACTN|nr:ATP-binding protein [Actinoplanes cyaneus]MCW2144299.1 Signal transduction histidine kinase [Actinoplanes cyaneus]GID71045.1 hypothetical protein Acy02nite_89260 [Actinoplanes cyaneus]
MTSSDAVFASGGETGRLMARLDWSATDLGPVSTWSPTLRAAVRTVLSSRYPMLLLWGPNLTQLYNDAYSTLIGDKHPAALGLDVRITLAEGWDVLAPLIEEATATGVASWVPALQLLLERSGYPEEAYFSVSHAPVRDDDGTTVGVLTVCSEVTDQVVGERRLRLLRDLALPTAGRPVSVDGTCAQLCEVIAEHPLDVPFAAVYLREGMVLRRSATVGGVDAALPEQITLDGAGEDPWRLRAAAGAVVAELGDVADRLTLTGGPWHDPVRTAVAQPLPSADRSQPIGVLLTGLSPSRALDETYRSFLQLLAQQAAVAIRNARAYQEERDRAAALAELDRAKTDFFTNISHEFRTPLTLMLGPLGDALADRAEPLGPTQHARVDTAWRNAGRLLTLVNELLTFAGIEAGAARPAPRVLDLARFTAELAGVFRAAVERTGLRLVVDCPPLPQRVAVDPELWEKIVTNLLSNALKFTFVGTIRVGLASDDTAVRLTVADTGIGIDAAELPRLFDRFHRVREARSRSHEGTGIGLALVRELTRLLGGDVTVDSEPGKGATFTVAVPWAALAPAGAADWEAAPDRLAAAEAAAEAAASEAAGWTDDVTEAPATGGRRILVADDNSDMRAYLSRLLTAQGWRVETVADGEAALRAVRRGRPELLISDVMMPRMDGFALVRALRADEATAGLPILMLSARAGQESGVEGLDAGADDYVVKPFGATELIARVRNMLDLSATRASGSRPSPVVADVASVIAAGRALEEPFRIATGYARALLGGRAAETVLHGDGTRPPLRFGDPADAGTVPGETIRAAIELPDGSVAGEIAVVADPRHPPDPRARDLLAALAGVLALLIRRDWQPGQDGHQPDDLRQSLLPQELPAPEGWELLPAVVEVADGGWYDAVTAPDGTLLISAGHVAGDGPGAVMAGELLRAAVRAHVTASPAPARLVGEAAALIGSARLPYPMSLLVVAVDPGTGAITWCSAGHSTPLYSAPGEQTRPLTGEAAPPLGSGGETIYPQNHDNLPYGGQLLLHGSPLVLDQLQREPTVDAALAAVPAPHEDLAVIAVRRRAPVPAPDGPALPLLDLAWTYPLDSGASAAARRDLRTALDLEGVDPDLLYDLQVAATEAINNAVEHAQRPRRPEICVRLRADGDLVRIEVEDFGDWRARPPARDRGRGAILMNAYGDVHVTTTTTGTLVTIERRWSAVPRD